MKSIELKNGSFHIDPGKEPTMFAIMTTTACTLTAIEWFTSGFMLGLTAYAATRDTIKMN